MGTESNSFQIQILKPIEDQSHYGWESRQEAPTYSQLVYIEFGLHLQSAILWNATDF